MNSKNNGTLDNISAHYVMKDNRVNYMAVYGTKKDGSHFSWAASDNGFENLAEQYGESFFTTRGKYIVESFLKDYSATQQVYFVEYKDALDYYLTVKNGEVDVVSESARIYKLNEIVIEKEEEIGEE